jgi:hypothetical protein
LTLREWSRGARARIIVQARATFIIRIVKKIFAGIPSKDRIRVVVSQGGGFTFCGKAIAVVCGVVGFRDVERISSAEINPKGALGVEPFPNQNSMFPPKGRSETRQAERGQLRVR